MSDTKVFGPDQCEVSDDEGNWKPAIGNVGKYVRVKPELWKAYRRDQLGISEIKVMKIENWSIEVFPVEIAER